MQKATFTPKVSDPLDTVSELEILNGQTVEVLGEIPPHMYDQEEIGRMYMIRFEDGLEADAFADELTFID